MASGIKFSQAMMITKYVLARGCHSDDILYKLLFSRGFYFREFREPDPRENFHFNSCLFIVMTTSEKSRN